jgi:hypothetical protein
MTAQPPDLLPFQGEVDDGPLTPRRPDGDVNFGAAGPVPAAIGTRWRRGDDTDQPAKPGDNASAPGEQRRAASMGAVFVAVPNRTGMSDPCDRMGSDRALPSPKAKAVAVAVDERLDEPRGPEPIGEARWIDRLEHVVDV